MLNHLMNLYTSNGGFSKSSKWIYEVMTSHHSNNTKKTCFYPKMSEFLSTWKSSNIMITKKQKKINLAESGKKAHILGLCTFFDDNQVCLKMLEACVWVSVWFCCVIMCFFFNMSFMALYTRVLMATKIVYPCIPN